MLNKIKFTKIILYVVSILIVSYLVFNDNGLIKFLKIRSELNTLNEEIKKTEDELTSLENSIKMIKSNRDTIEKVAREKFNMKTRNEKVIIVNEN